MARGRTFLLTRAISCLSTTQQYRQYQGQHLESDLVTAHTGSPGSMSVKEVFEVCFGIQEVRAKVAEVQTIQNKMLKGLLKICVTNQHSALQEHSTYAARGHCAPKSQLH